MRLEKFFDERFYGTTFRHQRSNDSVANNGLIVNNLKQIALSVGQKSAKKLTPVFVTTNHFWRMLSILPKQD